jgi:hypothetical protein
MPSRIGNPICACTPSDPHHIPFAQPRALGRKVSDEYTVPLCRGHHREVHRYGDEAAWWAKVGIEPLKVARKLWRQTRQTGAELKGGRHAETALQWPTSDPAADPKRPVSEVSPGTPTTGRVDARTTGDHVVLTPISTACSETPPG